MPKKPKNNVDDTFNFDSGGMDELFPLDSIGSNEKPPKGAKGYLKNVAKSVFNLGVKVNKQLYPEAFELGSQVFGNDDEGSKVNLKGILANIRIKAKEYKDTAKDVVKEISDDAKKAIKTGYFVKTEDEEMDMSAAFGDIFGDDSGFDFSSNGDISYDSGDDDFSISDDSSANESGSHLSTSETIVRAEAASTIANLRSANKVRSTIVGAAQSQLKQQSIQFAQQIEIENERHRQKMGVLKNIATNIAKQVEQNNLSIKAQMEFSAKSLAFAQDTAAMIKEIRSSIWAATKPQNNKSEQIKSTYSKIYGENGTSFNLKEFAKNWGTVSSDNSFGGIFGMLKMLPEMLETFTGMGMSKAQAIKMMGGGMVREGIVDAFTDFSTKATMQRFNTAIKGLPAQLNRKMIKWSEGTQVDDLLGKAADLPLLQKILGNGRASSLATLIKDQLGYASVRDQERVLTDRYKLGDPNKVHPFDNKAWKVLTDVIPHHLANIDAGVNHSEVEYFDYDRNQFLPRKSIAERAEKARREVARSSFVYSDFEDSFTNALTTNTADSKYENKLPDDKKFLNSDGSVKIEAFVKEFDKMYGNFQKSPYFGFSTEVMKRVKELDDLGGVILEGTALEETSNEIKQLALDVFVNNINSLRENKMGKNILTQLSVDQGSYISQLNNVNTQLEDTFSGSSSSILYQQINKSKYIQTEKKNIEFKIKQLENSLKTAPKGYDTFNTKKQIRELKARLVDINKTSKYDLYKRDINNGINFGSQLESNDFNQYNIKSLDDDSTHGLVKNIYNLLLSGIDVYTHQPKGKEYETHTNTVKDIKSQLVSKSRNNIEDSDIDFMDYSEAGTPDNFSESDEEYIKAFPLYFDDGNGKLTKKKFDTLKELQNDTTVAGKTLYKRNTDIRAFNKREDLKHSNHMNEKIGGSISRIPGLKHVYNLFNTVNTGFSRRASEFMYKNVYDLGREEDQNEDAARIITGDSELDKQIIERTKNFNNYINNGKSTITNIGKGAYESVKNNAIDTRNNHNSIKETEGKAFIIDDAIHFAKGIARDAKGAIEKTPLNKLGPEVIELYKSIKDDHFKVFKKLKTLFPKASFTEELNKIQKDAEKIWQEFDKDVSLTDKIKEIEIAKNKLLEKIKSSGAYDTLKDNEKQIFDRLSIDSKKTKIINSLSAAKKKLSSFGESAKDTLGELKGRASDYIGSAKNSKLGKKVSGIAGDIRNQTSKEFSKYKEAFDKEVVGKTIQGDINKVQQNLIKKLDPSVKKALSEELMNIKNDYGITLETLLSKVEDPVLLAKLKENENNPVDQDKLILAEIDKYPFLTNHKEKLSNFIIEAEKNMESRTNTIGGAVSYIISRKISKIRDKANDKIVGFLNKHLDKKLMNIKVGDKTLGQVLEELAKVDPTIMDNLSKFNTPTEKAQALLRMNNDEIKPFKKQIREFAESYDSKNATVLAGNMVWNKSKSMAKSAWNWIKENIGKIGKEKEELSKYLGEDLTTIFGGPENVMKTLYAAGIELDDIKALKTNDKVIIAKYLIEKGSFKGKTLKQLKVFISLIEEKRAIKKSGWTKSRFEEDRQDAQKKLDELNEKLSKNNSELDKKEYKRINKEKKAQTKREKSELKAVNKINNQVRKEVSRIYSSHVEIGKSSEEVKNETIEEINEKFPGHTIDLNSYINENINTDGTKKSKKKATAAVAGTGILSFFKKKDKSSSEGDGIVNSANEMKEDKEKKAQTKLQEQMAEDMKNMSAYMKKMSDDGMDLSDKTKKDLDDSNQKAAEKTGESISGEGGALSKLLGKIPGLEGVANVVGKAESALGAVSKLGGSPGVLGKVGGLAGKALSMGGSAAGAIAGVGKSVVSATMKGGLKAGAKAGLKGVGGLAKGGAKGILKGATTVFEKIFGGLAKRLGPSVGKMLSSLKGALKQGMSKFAQKLTAKLGTLSAAGATVILIVAAAAAGFTKGCVKAKNYFKVGKGMRITVGMRMAAGLADALDSALFGIPGLLCTLLGKASLPLWFYEIAGGKAEKEALERYRQYNQQRAKIFGVDDPDALVAYENRSQGEGIGGKLKSGLLRFGRAAASALTFGLVNNNDEADAAILGFKHVKIFKKWRDEKYKPLDDMRKTIAESKDPQTGEYIYGGLKLVEDVYGMGDIDKDDDGKVDDEEEAKKQAGLIEKQAAYRRDYLKSAKEYVISNHLAYLTTHCTAEDFEKYSHESAGDEITTGGARVKAAAKNFFNHTPIGMAFNFVKSVKQNGFKQTMSNIGAKAEASFKSFGEKAKKLMEKLGFNDKQKKAMEAATTAIVATEKKVDPTYHGDKVDNVKPSTNPNVEEGMVNVGQNGGNGDIDSGDGFFVKVKNANKPNISDNKDEESFSKKLNKMTKSLKNSSAKFKDLNYDMSGKVPKSTLMNSISKDFADKFGTELMRRLDILEEIQKENVRHNQVSEDFFTNILALVSQIAQNSGNTHISSKLDDMIAGVVSM